MSSDKMVTLETMCAGGSESVQNECLRRSEIHVTVFVLVVRPRWKSDGGRLGGPGSVEHDLFWDAQKLILLLFSSCALEEGGGLQGRVGRGLKVCNMKF